MSEPAPLSQATVNITFQHIGKSLPRVDAPGKAYGETVYAGDHLMPDMLHAKVLRSHLASARLRCLDVSKARGLAGVACVLTYPDLPRGAISTDFPGVSGPENLHSERQLLVDEIARYQGEPLALVAAESEVIAKKAIDLIEVELEPLPGVYDPFVAMKPGAPIIFGSDNIVAHYKVRKGDIDAGFAAADTIIENTFRTQFLEHAFLEPEAGLAWIDRQGIINIRTSTQAIEHFRDVAEVIGVPHNKVRIRGAIVGGAFGGKNEITVEAFLGLLTVTTGRPVRLCYSREESFFGHAKRHPFTITHTTGFTKDGGITAAKIDITSDSGPYVFMSPYVLLYATEAGFGPYRVDNAHIDSRSVATNNMYTGAFRGFGAVQACIAYEQQMDEAAKVLGIDRLELRRRNFLNSGDSIVTGFRVESAVWTNECMTKAVAALGPPTPDDGPLKFGRGFAAYQQPYGRMVWIGDTAKGSVGIELDGSVQIRSGMPDIGGGQISTLAQITAEILGVSMDTITVFHSDSATTPLAGMCTATRGVYMSGNAVHLAAEAVRGRLVARAAKEFRVDPGNILLADSRVLVADESKRSISLKDLVAICAADGIQCSELSIFHAPFAGQLDPETGQGRVHPDYTFGAHAVEVAVDAETGEVTVLKSIGAHDVGQAINPQAVAGQIEGGAAQGHGFALSEELIYENGCLQTPSLSEYLCPTAMDMCPIQSIILESRSGLGPFGAKGMGEVGITPTAAAIANAVADAIGVRIHDLPITPEKVVKALQQKVAADHQSGPPQRHGT